MHTHKHTHEQEKDTRRKTLSFVENRKSRRHFERGAKEKRKSGQSLILGIMREIFKQKSKGVGFFISNVRDHERNI